MATSDSATGRDSGADSGSGAEILTFYVALYSRVPAFDSASPAYEGLHRSHVDYQKSHFNAGRLVMGGPFVGEGGGMALFRAGSISEVQTIVAGDPAVQAGIYTVTVHEYQAVLNALGGRATPATAPAAQAGRAERPGPCPILRSCPS